MPSPVSEERTDRRRFLLSLVAVLAVAIFIQLILYRANGGSIQPSNASFEPSDGSIPSSRGSIRPTGGLIQASGEDPVFVGAGDIASCDTDADEDTAKLLDGIAGTVFTLGDNAYETGSPSEYLKCYEPTWGRHLTRTRPAPGNHEYLTPGAAGYFGYFSDGLDEGAGYYAYDLGTWRIYSLNSEVDVSAGSPQETWLRADLAAQPRACVLAYWHQPRFSSADTVIGRRLEPLWQALYKAGADVVLSAHHHDYERFAKQTPTGAPDTSHGIRQFVVGTGGSALSKFGVVRPNSEMRNDTTNGVLKLTLHAEGYDWEFIPVAGSSFTDAGKALCNPGSSRPSLQPAPT